jgi:hypothetical protein
MRTASLPTCPDCRNPLDACACPMDDTEWCSWDMGRRSACNRSARCHMRDSTSDIVRPLCGEHAAILEDHGWTETNEPVSYHS